MSNHNNDVKKVTDVIQVMKAGIEFYKDALKEVENEAVKTTFRKMIQNKESAVSSLQPLAVAEQGEKEDGTSFAVDSRKIYTKFTSMFTSNDDHNYVKQLEEVEDKVLEELDEAMKEDQPAHAMSVLRTVRANAQQMHDEMKALQQATS